MKESKVFFDRQINKSIFKKPSNHPIHTIQPKTSITKYVTQTSTARKYAYNQSPRQCETENNRSLPKIKTNQKTVENMLLFNRIHNKPLKLGNINLNKKGIKINQLNSTTQGSSIKSDMSSQITSRTVAKKSQNNSLPLIPDMKTVSSQRTFQIIEDNDLDAKVPEITTAMVEIIDPSIPSLSTSPNRRNSIGFKKRNSKNISYQDFLHSVKAQKSSKFSSSKRINDIDFGKNLEGGVDTRIIHDCIGKTYETTNDQNSKSSFFMSKGNFHCPSFFVFGVIEGNGIQGKEMASLARSNLHTYLTSGTTYGFKVSTVTEDQIYEAITYNDFESIKIVNERLTEDLIKSKYDIETSGVSVTVLFILGKRLISINVGDIQAVAYIEEIEKNKEKLHSVLLTSIDVKLQGKNKVLTNSLGNKAAKYTGIPTCYCTNITDEYFSIVIASKHFWEFMSYGNCFKFLSNIRVEDLLSKIDQIIQFKKKQNELYNRPDLGFSLVLIDFA